MKTKIERTNCLECNKEHGQTSYHTASHQRFHKRSLSEYLKIYFECLNPGFKEICLICKTELELNYKIDFEKKKYTKCYNGLKICNDINCKNNLSRIIFKNDYNPSQFSKIGSKTEYLALSKNISIEEAKKMKYSDNRDYNNDKSKTNLNGYILRYGNELGKIKYDERCRKIGYSNTLPWYIEKFGLINGKIKYKEYVEKIKNNTLGTQQSKISEKIVDILNNNNIKFKKEYPINCINKPYKVDFYIEDLDIVIEFFGDYWHMNPLTYEPSYFNKTMKMTAEEIWQKDKTRLEKISNNNKRGILVIWEGFDLYNIDQIINSLEFLKENKTIIYLQGNKVNRVK